MWLGRSFPKRATPAQVSEIDEQMDKYIDREHAGAVLWADDPGIRYERELYTILRSRPLVQGLRTLRTPPRAV